MSRCARQATHLARALARCLRALLISGACGAFALRMLIPVGYMPAALAEGGPIVLCDGGFAGAALSGLARHEASRDAEAQASSLPAGPPSAAIDAELAAHAHHLMHGAGASAGDAGTPPNSHSSHQAWKHCPLGAVAASAALAPSFALLLAALASPRPDTAVLAASLPRAAAPYRSRAPPNSSPA